MTDDLVTVATFRFLLEAQISKGRLEAEGMTVFLADAETVNMDWFLGNAIGFIKLQVPQSQAEAAAALIANMHEVRREREARHDDEDEPEVCLSCGATLSDEVRCPSCGWSYAPSSKVDAPDATDGPGA